MPETYEKYINDQVFLLKGEGLHNNQVKGINQEHHGNTLGKESSNMLLDTQVYEVELTNRATQEYATTTTMGFIYSQV